MSGFSLDDVKVACAKSFGLGRLRTGNSGLLGPEGAEPVEGAEASPAQMQEARAKAVASRRKVSADDDDGLEAAEDEEEALPEPDDD